MAEKEYIEREAIISKIVNTPTVPTRQCYEGNFVYADGVSGRQNEIINYINEQPIADVAPVKHGHWKKSKGNERPTENGFVHDDRYICDCCGWGCCCETKLDFSYCPKCGAKMDGGEGE